MADLDSGNSVGYVTTRLPFFQSEVEGKTRHLFEVGEGIPIVKALEQAYCILYAAHLSNDFLGETERNNLLASLALRFQLDFARALVLSVMKALED